MMFGLRVFMKASAGVHGNRPTRPRRIYRIFLPLTQILEQLAPFGSQAVTAEFSWRGRRSQGRGRSGNTEKSAVGVSRLNSCHSSVPRPTPTGGAAVLGAVDVYNFERDEIDGILRAPAEAGSFRYF